MKFIIINLFFTTLIIIIIYIINFSYQYNLAGAYHLNTFSISSIIIDSSIKKAKTLRKWNSMPEKKKKRPTIWGENWIIEFHFGRNQWSSMCNYKDETKKKKTREKTKSGKKENAESDLIVIEDDSLKQKKISNKRGRRWWPNTKWLEKKLLHKRIKIEKD